MKSARICAIVWLLAGLGMGVAPEEAQAQTRTWVSGVGDDANPCSRTAPCKTFAGAISKTLAGGEIDVLDPGGFGAVTITKAITIDGSGGSIAGVLVSGTNGIVVSAGANDVVTLRDLDFEGVGSGLNGIRFTAGGALQVERCLVRGFTQIGIDMEPNQSTSSSLVVSESVVNDNAGGGILVKPAGGGMVKAAVTRLTSARNKYGLRTEDNSWTSLQDSLLTENGSNGVIAVSVSAPSSIALERSVVSLNANGVVTSGAAATIYLSQIGIFSNATGINSFGGQVISFGNNQNAGNTTPGAPTSTMANQ